MLGMSPYPSSPSHWSKCCAWAKSRAKLFLQVEAILFVFKKPWSISCFAFLLCFLIKTKVERIQIRIVIAFKIILVFIIKIDFYIEVIFMIWLAAFYHFFFRPLPKIARETIRIWIALNLSFGLFERIISCRRSATCNSHPGVNIEKPT